MSNPSSKKTVMAFGTFDYFHAGHEDYLKQAKNLGATLIVVVARDETVKKVKGNAPAMNEKKRLRDVANCAHVDKAVLGYPGDKYAVIRKYHPQILALGYDQFAFTYGLNTFLIKENLDIEIHRLEAFEPQTFKSSLIRKSIEAAPLQDEDRDENGQLKFKIPLPHPSLTPPCTPDRPTLFAD